jgi:hypothetical protein
MIARSVMEDAGTNSLEARIDALEGRAAIEHLLAAFAHGVDTPDWDLMATVWHDDSVFDLGSFGRFTTRIAIVEGLRELADAVPKQHHAMVNALLDIRGHSATGRVAVTGVMTPAGQGAVAIGGIYSDRYERRGSRWAITRRAFEMHYWNPIAAWDPAVGTEQVELSR